jgi:DNA replication protein DnaC
VCSRCASNKSLEAWGDIFGDDVMASTLIDRLLRRRL